MVKFDRSRAAYLVPPRGTAIFRMTDPETGADVFFDAQGRRVSAEKGPADAVLSASEGTSPDTAPIVALEDVVTAIGQLDPANPIHVTEDGKPDCTVLADMLNARVSTTVRDAALAVFTARREAEAATREAEAAKAEALQAQASKEAADTPAAQEAGPAADGDVDKAGGAKTPSKTHAPKGAKS